MAASLKIIAFWDIAPCSLVEVVRHLRGTYRLMMEAVHTSEMLVYFSETTWCYIPEGYHLHCSQFKKLKYSEFKCSCKMS
jgi:hypothetical protein